MSAVEAFFKGLPTMKSGVLMMCIFAALDVGAVSEVLAETRVHRDWAGVTTWVGRVRISSRKDGRTITSIRVGDNYYHDSNFGLSGVTYQGTTGRIDVITNGRRGFSAARYWPDGSRAVGGGHINSFPSWYWNDWPAPAPDRRTSTYRYGRILGRGF